MNNYEHHLVDENITIKDALISLNLLRDENLTLFVISNNYKMVGTLTDGDIRRALLVGATIESKVNKFMFKNFLYLEEANVDLHIFKIARQKGINLLPLLDKSKNIKKIYDLKKIKSILPVDAILMAGGKGQRLMPLTLETPKPMLPLGEKPIIEHNIDRLISFGVENIYISVNYLAEKIEKHFGDGSSKGVTIRYIHEDKPLGTIGAIRNVEKYDNNTLLVMNSDLFTNINLETFFEDHILNNAAITVASIPYTVNIPYAIFKTEGQKILSFKEKPNNTHYANAGIYLMDKKVLSEIPENTFFNTTDLMNAILNNHEKIIHSPIYGYWIDIGQHEDYNKAKDIVKHLKDEQ
ncbi:MAG: nucleotidyltransferase family protein [Bacteroidales bacterium]|nr:nucleotidyltransferase family protein [Bacteroidales bacterium]